jgi:MFS family permease
MLERAGALQEPNFRRLWIGQTVSAAGDGLTGVALTFAVLNISGSATDLGLVIAAFLVPRVAFMLVGGVWADRLPRRLVMIGSDLVRALAQVIAAAAVLSGTHELWPFVASAAIGGAASAFFQPAVVGLIPQTVTPTRLQAANALLSISQSAARLFGPVIAGIAVAAGILGPLFVLDAASFVFSAVMLATLTVGTSGSASHQRFVDDFKDGWHQVTQRRWLVVSLAAFAFANLAFSGFFVLGPLIVQRDFGGAADWGLLMGLFALGSLLGAAIAMRWRPTRPLFAAFAIFTTVPLVLVMLATAPPFAVLLLGATLAAGGTTLTDTLWHTTLQQQIPDQHLSRVSSVDWTISIAITPVGAAVSGPLADSIGIQSALLVLAVVAGVPMVIAALAPSIRAIRAKSEPEQTLEPVGTLAAVESACECDTMPEAA